MEKNRAFNSSSFIILFLFSLLIIILLLFFQNITINYSVNHYTSNTGILYYESQLTQSLSPPNENLFLISTLLVELIAFVIIFFLSKEYFHEYLLARLGYFAVYCLVFIISNLRYIDETIFWVVLVIFMEFNTNDVHSTTITFNSNIIDFFIISLLVTLLFIIVLVMTKRAMISTNDFTKKNSEHDITHAMTFFLRIILEFIAIINVIFLIFTFFIALNYLLIDFNLNVSIKIQYAFIIVMLILFIRSPLIEINYFNKIHSEITSYYKLNESSFLQLHHILKYVFIVLFELLAIFFLAIPFYFTNQPFLFSQFGIPDLLFIIFIIVPLGMYSKLIKLSFVKNVTFLNSLDGLLKFRNLMIIYSFLIILFVIISNLVGIFVLTQSFQDKTVIISTSTSGSNKILFKIKTFSSPDFYFNLIKNVLITNCIIVYSQDSNGSISISKIYSINSLSMLQNGLLENLTMDYYKVNMLTNNINVDLWAQSNETIVPIANPYQFGLGYNSSIGYLTNIILQA